MKNELTKFGRIIRKYRIDKGENMKDMADSVGVSNSYLSQIERGKRTISPDLIGAIADYLELNKKQTDKLAKVADENQLSRKTILLRLNGVNKYQRELAMMFARQFKRLNAKDASKIMEILMRNTL